MWDSPGKGWKEDPSYTTKKILKPVNRQNSHWKAKNKFGYKTTTGPREDKAYNYKKKKSII